MDAKRFTAITHLVLSTGVAAFQVALAAGAPWGSYAMGGAFPGQFPPSMRVAALTQAVLLMLMTGVVLARAGVALARWQAMSRWAVWLVVAFAVVSLVLNLATPSAGERMIWAPVTLLLLACSLVVALGKMRSRR